MCRREFYVRFINVGIYIASRIMRILKSLTLNYVFLNLTLYGYKLYAMVVCL